ncbi:hypothetical protein MKK67_11610 [Methylobacterium sp. J-072]|uniref:hypothetical protein n=1 Tax=Methylobacterium sp. J-072 TaxID=2836651 RepID=UPI001FBB0445|nr:hypothetical protein [Methylobacterium sp. J-072]MCJ2093138.1 hypothetical protein [Methylobacterium sp. J-072]
MRRLGDPEQGADLLVDVEPATGEPQQFITGGVEAETIDPAMSGMQAPVEPADAGQKAEKPHGLG